MCYLLTIIIDAFLYVFHPELPLSGPQNRKQGLNSALSFVCFLCASCDCVSAKWFSTEKNKIITDLPCPLETTPPLVEEEGVLPSEF